MKRKTNTSTKKPNLTFGFASAIHCHPSLLKWTSVIDLAVHATAIVNQ
jgi:hypothetical protein